MLKVEMRAKKVVITFLAIAFFVKFLWDIFTVLSLRNSECLYRAILHQVSREEFSGTPVMGLSL